MSRRQKAHLNLVDSSRQLFALDPGAEVEATDGWLFGAGSSAHPTIANAAFRADDGLDPGELLERARAFFAARGRGFALWARGDAPEDSDLITAVEDAGLEQVYAMPEMVLDRRTEERPPPKGAELCRVTSPADAEDYWRVATAAYADLGFPPEIFAAYTDHAGLQAGNVAAFLARLEGRPAGIAMTIVSHGVAGIYWVGSSREARGRGLGWTMTASAVDAGFEMGARDRLPAGFADGRRHLPPDGLRDDLRVPAVLVSSTGRRLSTIPAVIYLLRHGEAVPRGEMEDAARALTAKGERQSLAAGKALVALGAELGACLTSPKVRAADTARLACEALSLEPETATELGGGPFEAAALGAGRGDVLLVGHEPDFSNEVARLTGAKVKLRKGGLAIVDDGTLLALLRPRELAALAATQA